MIDLDRQIARMKGWEYDWADHGWYRTPEDKANGWLWIGGLLWTGDEAAALDLADELTAAGLEVTIASWWTPETGRLHRVTVAGLKDTPDAFRYQVEAGTRPAAICRAYIKAREWMTARPTGG